MALSYPHRQTIIIGAVCLVAIAAVAFYTQRSHMTTASHLDVQPATHEQVSEDLSLASTSTNWQKDFFAVSTTTSTKNNSGTTSGTAKNASSTLTDKMSKDFFARYMVLKQAGQTTNDASVKDAVSQTIANAASSATPPKTYSTSDIRVTNDVSSSAIHTYANTVASIMLTYISKLDPTEIATDALDNQTPEKLSEIDPIISGYQKTIAELLAVNVPQDLSGSHVDILNGLSILLYTSQGLRHIQDDSAQAMIALGVYPTGQDTLKSGLLDTKEYLSAQNIQITSTEPGYLFFTIVQ